MQTRNYRAFFPCRNEHKNEIFQVQGTSYLCVVFKNYSCGLYLIIPWVISLIWDFCIYIRLSHGKVWSWFRFVFCMFHFCHPLEPQNDLSKLFLWKSWDVSFLLLQMAHKQCGLFMFPVTFLEKMDVSPGV